MPSLPIILIVGPDDSVKVNLALRWREEFSIQGKSWALAVNSDYAVENATQIPACLCCTGKATLLSKLTQLLRRQRQNPTFEGIILVANAGADVLVTLEQLGQPLLQGLVFVSQVVYYVQQERRFQAEVALNSDLVIGASFEKGLNPAVNGEHAEHFERRHFYNPPDCSNLRITSLSLTSNENPHTGTLFRWPVDAVFNRSNLETIFDNQGSMYGMFDAVFRTKREWYRWNYSEQRLIKAVALFRRESYLSFPQKPRHLEVAPLIRSIDAQILTK
jgi:hypothetical protein